MLVAQARAHESNHVDQDCTIFSKGYQNTADRIYIRVEVPCMCTTTVAGKPCSASNLREQWTYGDFNPRHHPCPCTVSVGRGASRGSPLGVSLVPREYFTRPKDGHPN